MALSEDSKVALKIAHLNMIQGAIARMSGFSASAKTFTITILAGLAAISLEADKAKLGFVALLATIVLGVIDVYYMTLELRFRALYEDVRGRSLDLADDLDIKPLKRSGDIRRALNSTPTKLFYLPVFGACVLFIGYGLMHDWWSSSEQLSGSNSSRVERPAVADSAAPAKRVRQLPQQPESAGTRGPVRPEATDRPSDR